MKLLIAVDGSSYTRRMLAYVAAHDDTLFTLENEYTVLTAVPAVPPRAAAVFDKETLADFYLDEAEKVLKPVRTFFAKKGYSVKTMHKVGPPGPVIAKIAADGRYDLIVMGSHGRSALANLVMGSVATQVLAHCSTPVLLVR